MKIRSVLTARFGLVHDDFTCYRCQYMRIIHQMLDFHVTGVSTLCWYYLCNCMLLDWYNISDCDCQHGISYYRIYRLRLGVSVWIVSAEFVSSRFCRVQFQCFFVWLRFTVSLIGEFPFSNGLLPTSIWIFDCYLVLETCIGT